MRFIFFILLLASIGHATEDEVTTLARMVKIRKIELKEFRKNVSEGDRCRSQDFDCFRREVMNFAKGHVEDIIEARSILEPFYQRSIKDESIPCGETCQNTMLAQYIKLYMDYLDTYEASVKSYTRFNAYPTVSGVRLRTYMELSAFHSMQEDGDYLELLFAKLDLGKVTRPELTQRKVFEVGLVKIDDATAFRNSILCHLSSADQIYNDILVKGEISGKPADKNFSEWLAQFEKSSKEDCVDRSPFVYRGMDKETRELYQISRDSALGRIFCKPGDFPCFRKAIKDVGIRYAQDVDVVGKKIVDFAKKSKKDKCDDDCKTELLLRTIQTWISFLSTYEREKLASTLDWGTYPEARFLTITEDVDLYGYLKEYLNPLIAEYGKIDPKAVKNPGLKSELASVGKDLSEFASGNMLKDSVICTMNPWKVVYDQYLYPYEDKARNKKFEAAFLEFKSALCK